MAAVLLSSGAQGKRFSLPHSKTMIHQPMSSVGPYTQESDFKIAYDELKKAKDMLYQILSKNTGKSIEEITADADRDHWLTAEECLPGVYGPFGLIDKIITKK
jgi:ATP-dependent Clp protease protease subunit